MQQRKPPFKPHHIQVQSESVSSWSWQLLIGLSLALLFSFYSSAVLADCSYRDDPELREQKNSCTENSAMRWDCQSNRCVTKTVDDKNLDPGTLRNDFLECRGIDDYEERRSCLLENARKYAKESTFEPTDNLDLLAAGMNAIYFGMAALSGRAAKKTSGRCWSRTVMGATSIVGLAMEIKLQLSIEDRMEYLSQEYEDQAQNENPFEAQVQALEFLKKREEEVVDIAGEREKLHLMMMIGYGASGALALAELSSPEFAKNCGYEMEEAGGDAADLAEGDVSDGMDAMEGMEGGGDLQYASMSGNFWRLNHPGHVLIAAGIGVGFSTYLYSAAKKQIKDSESNIKYLENIIAVFRDSMAGFCPGGRNDMSNPECYCYRDNGERNPNRTESETCQQYWDQQDRSMFASASDYDKNMSGDRRPAGCVFVNGRFDQNCRCREMEDDHGNNACYKAPSFMHNMGGLGHAMNASEYANNMEKLASGDFGIGDLDAESLRQQASRIRGIQDEMLRQVNNKRKKEGKDPIEINPEEMAKGFATQGPIDDLMSEARSMDLGHNFPQLSDEDAPKLSGSDFSSNNLSMTGGSGLASALRSKDKKNDFNFDFSSSGRSNAGRVDHFDGDGYNYKDDDIVNNEGASIWSILTHRYNTSGLRRLFPDEN